MQICNKPNKNLARAFYFWRCVGHDVQHSLTMTHALWQHIVVTLDLDQKNYSFVILLLFIFPYTWSFEDVGRHDQVGRRHDQVGRHDQGKNKKLLNLNFMIVEEHKSSIQKGRTFSQGEVRLFSMKVYLRF